jgi:signal transduction histidine kinase
MIEPVFALLLLGVLAPTACVLWFMNRTVENERLVAAQRLDGAYRGNLTLLQERLERSWRELAHRFESLSTQYSGAMLFEECIRAGASSAICLDDRSRVSYPDEPRRSNDRYLHDPVWKAALDLEQGRRNWKAAAQAYAKIAADTAESETAGRALFAQARCLVRLEDDAAALSLLLGPLAEDRFQNVLDWQGRSLAAMAEWTALERLHALEEPRLREVQERFQRRLLNYADPSLTSGQRRFLMNEFARLFPEAPEFSMRGAENLAARWRESRAIPPHGPELRPGSLAGTWEILTRNRAVLLLYEAPQLAEQLSSILDAGKMFADATVAILPPSGGSNLFLALPAGASLPGWRLGLTLKDRSVLDAAAQRQVAVYVWTGVLVIVAIVIIALVAAGTVRRQIELTRLKNDLVANVTHELKTPLSSMRLLVETLLDRPNLEEATTREYLELIARENSRLSRLIDNFLTFSRMERNKYAFDFATVLPENIISAAAAAVRERFQSAGCELKVECRAPVPPVRADADAMVTALINLLDNAFKYSGDDKRIAVRAEVMNGCVLFKVSDNGIGLAPREARRIFKRFYQVDEHLSRRSGGCGLGLSIVQFIVQSHRGKVRVASKPGEGSEFTIAIPRAEKS